MALGLAGVVLVVLAPRLFALDALSWWVTVAVGVAIGLAVTVLGYAKRDSTETHGDQPDE
ncbi:MAG: hypothetical protein AAGI91_11780 [Bacteroidota bacterium]